MKMVLVRSLLLGICLQTLVFVATIPIMEDNVGGIVGLLLTLIYLPTAPLRGLLWKFAQALPGPDLYLLLMLGTNALLLGLLIFVLQVGFRWRSKY